jgi:hypothetical protein
MSPKSRLSTHRMTAVLFSFGAIASSLAIVGCSSDSPTEPETETETGITLTDLVGSWIATSDVHTNNADASETFDLVGAGGEVRTTVLANGGARTWVTLGTFSDEWDAAVTIFGSTLSSDPVEAGRPTRVWQITLVNGVLTMTDDSAEFDFTMTGAAPVSTTEVVVFIRN